MSGSSGLSRLRQIALPVRDPARATAFYRDVLGLSLLFEAPPGLAFFDLDGIRLMLGPAEGGSQPPGSVLYFAVDDIQAAYEHLKARGVTFRSVPRMIAKLPDREVWLADFQDGEGNTLALMAEPAIRT